MKRRSPVLQTILIFLLLGSILNVAVAWGISGFIDYWGDVSFKLRKASLLESLDIELPDEEGKEICAQYFSAAKKFPSDHFTGSIRISIPGLTTISGRKWIVSEYSISVDHHCIGLPMRSLKLVETEYLPPIAQNYEWTIHGGFRFQRGWDFRTSGGIPLIPIWPGFIFNTLFYAIPLWLLFPGRYMLRRRRRIQRGLCGQCGYMVAPNLGVPGASPNCPECGTPFPPPSPGVGIPEIINTKD